MNKLLITLLLTSLIPAFAVEIVRDQYLGTYYHETFPTSCPVAVKELVEKNQIRKVRLQGVYSRAADGCLINYYVYEQVYNGKDTYEIDDGSSFNWEYIKRGGYEDELREILLDDQALSKYNLINFSYNYFSEVQPDPEGRYDNGYYILFGEIGYQIEFGTALPKKLTGLSWYNQRLSSNEEAEEAMLKAIGTLIKLYGINLQINRSTFHDTSFALEYELHY